MPKTNLPGLSTEEISAGIQKAVFGIEFSSFEVGVSCPDAEKKAGAREKAIDFVSERLGKTHLSDGFDLYILFDLEKGIVQATPQSIYVEGRYNKLSRTIAQTFHYCFKCKGRGKGCAFCKGTGKLSKTSVQELLAKSFLPAFGANETKFHGCGREDVDVLMLGEGRPFVLELVAPNKRTIDLPALEQKINSENSGAVEVHGLRYCKKGRVAQLKNDEFQKIYSAKCECEELVDLGALQKLLGQKFDISQRTPERVEKRRADRERPRRAEIISAKLPGPDSFSLEILSSHGLYIKEFISGDNGRTTPSISSLLGKKCACRELDVLEIILCEQEPGPSINQARPRCPMQAFTSISSPRQALPPRKLCLSPAGGV